MSSVSSLDSDSDEERAIRGKLFSCVDENNFKTLQHLFEELKYDTQSLVDAKDKNDDNNNLLQKAIKRRKRKGTNQDDNTKIIELLLSHGADPEATNDSGFNAHTLFEKRSKKATDGVNWTPVGNLLSSAKNMGRDAMEPMETEEWSFTKNSETYKSSGLKTSLHGTIYQLQLLVLFLHRAVHAYDSILLATELDVAEKFDDVVLKFKTDKQSKFSWRFLQAKHIQHVDKTHFIKESELFSANDKMKFPLGKYFQSFCQIKDNRYFDGDEFEEFTLCTNTIFSDGVKKYFKEDKQVKTDKILYIKKQDVRKYKLTTIGKEKIKDMVQVLLAPNNKVGKKPTKAKTPKSTDEKYKDIKLSYLDEFVDKFRFMVNYPDRSRLNVLLKKEVGKNAGLLDADLATNDLKNSLLEWFISYANKESNFLLIKDGKDFLKKISLRIKLLMVSGLSKAHPEKLSNYNVKFQHMPRKEFDTFFKTNDYNLLHVISEATLPSCIKMNQYLEEESGFYLKKDSVIFLPVSKMRLEKIQKLIFDAYGKEGSHNLLVLDCGKENSKIEANKCLDILCNCVGKKLVVVGDENNILVKELLDSQLRINCLKVKDESSFKDLAPATQQRLIQTSIHFQGHEIPLYDILDSNAANNLLDPHMIETVIKQTHLRIDDPPAFDPLIVERSNYMNRTFSRQAVKSFVLLRKHLLDSHLMLVSNATPEALGRLKADKKRICMWKDFEAKKIRNGILAVPPEEDIKDIVVKVYKRKKGNGSVYWLDYSEGVLYFEGMHGSISHVKDLIVSDSSDKVGEEVFSSSLTVARNITILVGDPGSGKSTFIANFHANLKSTNKSIWVKKIHLNDHVPSRAQAVKALDSITFTEKDHDLAVDFLTHMLFGIKKEGAKGEVEKKLFKQSLLKGSGRYPNIILLFDGFDEICPKYKENTLILLKALQNTRVLQMWITTRRHEKWNLEAALDSPAIFLNPLDSIQKLKYIESITGFQSRDNLDVYESICVHLKNIKLSVDEPKTSRLGRPSRRICHEEMVLEGALNIKFVNTPLQVKMFAEVLLASRNYKIRNLGMLDLYREFINIKLGIYHSQKVSPEIQHLAYIEMCQRDSDGLIALHERLACQLLFPEMNENSISDVDRIGLIRVGLCVNSENNSFGFIHRSFAEYFISGYIANNLHLRSIQSLLFWTIFVEEGYTLVRMFLEENEIFLSNLSQGYEVMVRLTKQQLGIDLNILSREKLRHILKTCLLLLAEHNLELLEPLRSASDLKLRMSVILILHSREIFSSLYDSVRAFHFNSALKPSKVCHPTQILFKFYEGSQITELLDVIYNSETSILNMVNHIDENGETLLHIAARRGRFDHIQQLLVWIDQKTGSATFTTLPSCNIKDSKCDFEQQHTAEVKLSLLMLHGMTKLKVTFMHVMKYHESFYEFLEFLFKHFEKPDIEHLLQTIDWDDVSIINYCVMTLQKDDRVLSTLLRSMITHLDPGFITDVVLKVTNFKRHIEFIDDLDGEYAENKSYSTLLDFCLDHFEPQIIKERLLEVEGENLLHYTVVQVNNLKKLLSFLKSKCNVKVIKELLFHPDKNGCTPMHLAVKVPLSSSCCRTLLEFARHTLKELDFTRLLLTQDNIGNSVLHCSCKYLAGNRIIRDMLEYCRTHLSEMAFRKLVFLEDKKHQTFIFKRDLNVVNKSCKDVFILRNGLCAFNGTDLEQLLNIVNHESMTVLHVLMQDSTKSYLMEDILNNVKEFCSAENIRNLILKLDGRGRTLLHYSAHEASSANYFSLLDLCITRLDPSTVHAILLRKDQDGSTVLHHAISHKLQVTSELISFIRTDPKILLNLDQRLRTPLHTALLSGQPLDVVLNGLLVPTKSMDKESLTTLLTCSDSTGNTILHYGQKIFEQGGDLLEFFREHLRADQFKAMLCQHNDEGFTLLHHSMPWQVVDAVLGHLKDDEVLILLQPGRLGTLLHNLPGQVEEDYIWRLLHRLRKRLGKSEIQKFVVQTDEHQRTAMHSSRFSRELWSFCFKYFDREKLRDVLIMKDEEGKSAIHHHMVLGDTKRISYLFDKIKTVFDDTTLKTVLCVNDLKGQTPIHVMVNQCPSNAAVLEVVREFVGPDNFLHFVTDSKLLYASCQAPTILKYLVTYVKNHMDAASFHEFVSSSDGNGRNVLRHAILMHQIDSFGYLVDYLEPQILKKLMLSADSEGGTILHDVVPQITTREDMDIIIAAIRKCLVTSELTSLFLKLTHQRKSSVLHSLGISENESLPAILKFAMEDLKEDELIQLLCSADKDNRTVLHYAVSYYNDEILIQLLQRLGNNGEIFERLVFWQDTQGHTPLHIATMFNTRMVDRVITQPMQTLLKFIKNHLGSEVLTRLLLMRDLEGLSILQYSCRRKYDWSCYEILKYAKKNLDDSAFDCFISAIDYKGRNILHHIAYSSCDVYMSCVESCVSTRCGYQLLSEVDPDGRTFLHYLIASHNYNGYTFLKYLADIFDKTSILNLLTTVDKEQRTPLHVTKINAADDAASFHMSISFCYTFFDIYTFCELVSLRDCTNQSIFLYTFAHKHCPTVNFIEFLIEHHNSCRPLLSHINKQHQNFLHFALKQKYAVVEMQVFLKFLARMFPDIKELCNLLNAKDVEGKTPLDCLCYTSHLEQFEENFLFYAKMIPQLSTLTSSKDITFETRLSYILMDLLRINMMPEVLDEMFANQEGQAILNEVCKGGNVRKLLKYTKYNVQNNQLITPESMFLKRDDCVATQLIKFYIYMLYQDL